MKTIYAFALGLTALTACALDDGEQEVEDSTAEASQALTATGITAMHSCTDPAGCADIKISPLLAGRDCFITGIKGNLHAGGSVSVGYYFHYGAEGGWYLHIDPGLTASAACIDGVTVAANVTWTQSTGPITIPAGAAPNKRVCGFTSIENTNGFGSSSDSIQLAQNALNQTWLLTGHQAAGEQSSASAHCWDEPQRFGPFGQDATTAVTQPIPPTGTAKMCSLTKLGGDSHRRRARRRSNGPARSFSCALRTRPRRRTVSTEAERTRGSGSPPSTRSHPISCVWDDFSLTTNVTLRGSLFSIAIRSKPPVSSR